MLNKTNIKTDTAAAVPYIVDVGLGEQVLKEAVGVTQATAGQDVLVGDETITPVETKHVLASTCRAAVNRVGQAKS